MKKLLFLLFITHYSLLIANAQVTQDWVSRYNGPGNNVDYAYSMAVDGSGNVYVTGTSSGSGTSIDYATIKYNSAGVQQWAARYNGPGNGFDDANSIALDGSGNIYVTGRSEGSTTNYDYSTIKYNSAGVQQWVQRYNGPANGEDGAYSIAIDGSGNVYVTGRSDGGAGYGYDYATIKYNSSGVQQWLKRFNGGNQSDIAFSIAVDGSGNAYVTGQSWIIGTSSYDYATIKYSAAGFVQWVQTYNGPGNGAESASSITVDGSGNVYVTGQSIGSGTNYDYATIKYNSSGIQQWVARYNGPGNNIDYAYSMALDGSGNIYVTGSSRSSSASGTEDYATIKYNSSGIQQWVQRYNGLENGGDVSRSIAIDGSGNVYVTGESIGSGVNIDYATIKYNSSGVQQWVQRYNATGNYPDKAYSIKVDASGNVYVTGHSYAIATSSDYATIKYSQPVGIAPTSNEIPDAFQLEQNYPNPFNPATKIRFALPKNSFANLVVYDVLGREMETILNEQLNAGTYEVDWNASQYASGIYYYTLSIGEFNQTRKAVLIK